MSSIQAVGEPTVDLDVQIGRHEHQLMWDRQITQVELGRRISMDQSSVAKRFRGKLGWSATQVKAAADALNTTVAYLYGETEDPSPTRPVGPTGIEPMTSTVEYEHLADVLPFRKAA